MRTTRDDARTIAIVAMLAMSTAASCSGGNSGGGGSNDAGGPGSGADATTSSGSGSGSGGGGGGSGSSGSESADGGHEDAANPEDGGSDATSDAGDDAAADAGDGGAPTDAGNGGGTDAGPAMLLDGGSCTVSSETLGVHIKFGVTWSGNGTLLAATAGADLWLILNLDYSGTNLSGTGKACGLDIPPYTTTVSSGSRQVSLGFDPAVWDAHTLFPVSVNGTASGFASGDTLDISPTIALAGLGTSSPYANLAQAWPPPSASNPTFGAYPQFSASDLADDDGDGPLGITMTPSNAAPYVDPETSLNYALNTASAVDFAFRLEFSLAGKRSSCTAAAGTASVPVFDEHVVGCTDAPIDGGVGACAITYGIAVGAGFVDANRPIYVPGSATFTAARLPSSAKCAYVRIAVP